MKFGLEPVLFLAEPNLALWSIIAVLVWQAVGFYVVLFSAGMASIPSEIYEAAELDGATRVHAVLPGHPAAALGHPPGRLGLPGHRRVRRVRHRRVISVDSGGPDGATTVLAMEIYRNAFVYSQYGYASAMGVVLFFLTLTFAALTLRVTRRESVEY